MHNSHGLYSLATYGVFSCEWVFRCSWLCLCVSVCACVLVWLPDFTFTECCRSTSRANQTLSDWCVSSPAAAARPSGGSPGRRYCVREQTITRDKHTGSGYNFHEFSDSYWVWALRLHSNYLSENENAGMFVSSRDRFILTRDRDPIPCSLRAHNQWEAENEWKFDLDPV